MTTSAPNSELDLAVQEIARLRQEVRELDARVAASEQFNLKILQTLKRLDETFDLRVARAQFNVFNHMAHSLEHTIESYQDHLTSLYRGFNVEVVDGVNVKENSDTIVVRRRDNSYDFSKAVDPDTVMNQGTEAFVKYFDENPEVFGDREELLVNITTYTSLLDTAVNDG